MKKITYFLTLLCGVFVLASCSDDRDSNPVVRQPDSFVLNEPGLSGNVYDLANSDYITVTCKQPDYGYTALVTYYAQVSLDNTWNDAIYSDDGEVTTDATYVQLEGSFTECKLDLDANLINRAILTLGDYTSEDKFPEQPTTIYIRLMATLTSGYGCYSNSISLKVKAFYQELSEAAPEMWFLTGACIGDGSWSVDRSSIGVGLVPMSLVDGYEYSATTGKGELTYTGYFLAGQGFKLIRDFGWTYQWGNSGGEGIDNPVENDGGSSNLAVPTDGYYTITLNTANETLSIEQSSASPTAYGQMLISGNFNEWATDDAMTAVNVVDGMVNHIWTYKLGVTENDEVKFLVDSSWSPNWGASNFPYGFGVNNGPNIPVDAGDYTIIFNDVDGCYQFFDDNE